MWIYISNYFILLTSGVDPDPEVQNKGEFSTETAEKRHEEQTEGGHHRRHSPGES